MPGSPIHRGRFPAPPPNLPRLQSTADGIYPLVSRMPRGKIPGPLERLSDTEPRMGELDIPPPLSETFDEPGISGAESIRRFNLSGSPGADRIGLATPLFVAGPGARQVGQPQITNNTTVNVPPAPAPAVPRTGIAGPMTDEERALVNQGGWAGASAAVQPLLGDWRTSPLQVISAALGGYNQGRYGAQQDLAANRQKQLELQAAQEELQMRRDAVAAKQKQAAMLEAQIAKLPPDQQDKVRMLYGLGATEQAAKVISPEAGESKVLPPGAVLVDAAGKTLAQGAPEEMTPYQKASLALEQWKATHPTGSGAETWSTLSGDEAKALGLPEGTVAQRSNRGELKTTYKPGTQNSGITYTDADGNTFSIGGSAAGAQQVKLPQGFRMADPSKSAQELGITEKVAAPLPGTPEYGKAVDTISAVTTYQQQLSDLKDLFAKHGTQVWPSEAKGQLQSLVNNIKLSYAHATGQGALQKTDDAVISSVIGAVTDPMALLPGGQDQVAAQIEQAIAMADQDVQVLQQQYPWADLPRYTPKSSVSSDENFKPLPAPTSGGQAGPTVAGAGAAPSAQPERAAADPKATVGRILKDVFGD